MSILFADNYQVLLASNEDHPQCVTYQQQKIAVEYDLEISGAN